MGNPAKNGFGETAWKWLLRFIKFNIVGFIVFLIGTFIFELTFHNLGMWAWFVSSGSGGILQFILISYLNRTKKGKIFDSGE
jgi:O-antigen/teichoic acid export membrane protein